MSDVRIPDAELNLLTTSPDEAQIPVAVVRLMADELLQFRKKEADYKASWFPRANPPSLGDS